MPGGAWALLRAAGACRPQLPAARVAGRGGAGARKGAGGGGLTVWARSPDGDTRCIELSPTATVADLRDAIGTSGGTVCVAFHGEELRDSAQTLADAGIGAESVVDVVPCATPRWAAPQQQGRYNVDEEGIVAVYDGAGMGWTGICSTEPVQRFAVRIDSILAGNVRIGVRCAGQAGMGTDWQAATAIDGVVMFNRSLTIMGNDVFSGVWRDNSGYGSSPVLFQSHRECVFQAGEEVSVEVDSAACMVRWRYQGLEDPDAFVRYTGGPLHAYIEFASKGVVRFIPYRL